MLPRLPEFLSRRPGPPHVPAVGSAGELRAARDDARQARRLLLPLAVVLWLPTLGVAVWALLQLVGRIPAWGIALAGVALVAIVVYMAVSPTRRLSRLASATLLRVDGVATAAREGTVRLDAVAVEGVAAGTRIVVAGPEAIVDEMMPVHVLAHANAGEWRVVAMPIRPGTMFVGSTARAPAR